MPVVRLVEEPEDEELRQLYERMSSSAGPVSGVLNVFKTVAHNPRLLRAWMRMGTVLLAPGGITLSPRLREIAILRIAQQCGSEYEFAHHIRIAQQAGLSEEEIASLQNYDRATTSRTSTAPSCAIRTPSRTSRPRPRTSRAR